MVYSFKTIFLPFIFTGLLALASGAQASNFIGDVCFGLDIPDDDEGETEILVLGISEIGGGHYAAHGYTLDSPADPAEERTMLRGNIELFGSTIVMSLQGSYSNEGEALAITGHAYLSALTLSGTITIIGTFVDTGFGESGVEAQSGTIFPVACPGAG